MNKVLILGNSNIAKKRLIPALSSIPSVNNIEIASINGNPSLFSKVTKIHNSYEEAINNFDGDLVYISLANHLHDKYLKLTIERGFNCVIDKPAILKEETLDFLKLKNLNKKIIAESVVFMKHPAWNYLINKLEGPSNISKVIGNFMIPDLDINNFRMNEKYYGGALNDMSAYAMGMGRWLWNCNPKEIKIGNLEIDNNLVKSFSFIADYGSNRLTMGTFGFGYEYFNKVTMFGKNAWGEFDRVFSAPPDMNIFINGKSKNQVWKQEIQKSDSFKIFFQNIFDDINNKKSGDWFKKVQNTFSDYSQLSNEINKWRNK